MANSPLGSNDRLGHHVISQLISVGGSGAVYLARDTNLQREVAIKVLLPHLNEDKDSVERFLREAREMAKLSHPNIAQVYEVQVDTARNLYYFTMEYFPNGSLADWIRERIQRKVPFDERQIIAIAREVAEGLAFAHSKGRIHRDLKPDNILQAADGSFKIVDFGLAKKIDRGADQSHFGMFGSPRYMSPEQANGQPQDQRSDLYSFGVVLFEMLSGRPPFESKNVTQLLIQHIRDAPPNLRQLNARVSSGSAELVGQLLAKKPGDRPATADKVLAALRRLPARRTGLRPIPTALAAIALVALVMGLGYLVVSGRWLVQSSEQELRSSPTLGPSAPPPTIAKPPSTNQGGSLSGGSAGEATPPLTAVTSASPGSGPTSTILVPTATWTPRPVTVTPTPAATGATPRPTKAP